jgi:broad specificity phosphatase PhoE
MVRAKGNVIRDAALDSAEMLQIQGRDMDVAPMRLILVRHGEAHAGFVGPIAGPKGCAGLTDLGRRQAAALRDHLATTGRVHADVLVASLLPRAIQTAEIIAPGLGLAVSAHDCGLCEVHTGAADGMDWAQYNERFGSFDMEAEPDRVFAVGGDSWSSFHQRVGETLDRLAREHAGETVVAVCHAGVIMASMRLLLGIVTPATSAHLRPSNTGLTEWEHEPQLEAWILRSYNEAVHLIGVPPAARPDDQPVVLPSNEG